MLVRFLFACEAAGAASTRLSLRPLYFLGRTICRTRARSAPRECGCASRSLSCSAKAGHPVRRGFSIQSLAPLEYWVARS